MPRRVVVVAAVLLATGLVLAGREAGASVPSAPRRAAGFDGRVRAAVMAPTAAGSLVAWGDFTQVGGAGGRRLALFG